MLSDCLGETLSETETSQLKKLISELKLQREKNKSNGKHFKPSVLVKL